MKAALEHAQEYLSNDLNAPIELLLQIQSATQSIDFDMDSRRYFSKWLESGGENKLDSMKSAETLFIAGFDYCQEAVDYQFFEYSEEIVTIELTESKAGK
jgi:hypothetical protein